MKFQTKYGNAASGEEVGNCLMTCVANVLDKEIQNVPNIEVLFMCGDGSWLKVFQKWLEAIGYIYEVIDQDNPPKKNELYFANGMTERDTMHTVIYKNGKLYFDPHPCGVGLKEVKFFSVIRKP